MRTAILTTVAALVAVLALPGAAGATPGPGNAPEYWFDDWQITSLWQAGARGQGITIGEIDTGVNAELGPLRDKVLVGKDFGDSGGDGRIDRDEDSFGHGTAMASIMVAGRGVFGIQGIAPAAKILPLAVPLTGTTDAQSDDRIADAIRYATVHGANIINMSLGGKRSPKVNSQSCPPDEQSAIYEALRKGVIVVASIGNTGPDTNAVEEPAVCLGVVSVAALDATGTVAAFSTRQPYVTLSAPGVNIPSLSRVSGEAFAGDGTSQATAIVSAVLALAWSKHPELTGRDIVARALATLDSPRTKPSPAYGYGLLDGYRTVTADVPANAPNPVYAAAEPFLARDAAFEVPIHAPKPDYAGQLDDGGYAVSRPSHLSRPLVIGGVATAGGGVVALFLLGSLGLRRRTRRPVQVVELPPFVPAAAPPSPVWADLAAKPAHTGDEGRGEDARPRPRPRPRPHPGALGDPAGQTRPRPRPGPRL